MTPTPGRCGCCGANQASRADSAHSRIASCAIALLWENHHRKGLT